MNTLAILRELQSIYDHLRTIERDLSSFPSDLAALDVKQKSLGKHLQQMEKDLEAAKAEQVKLTKDLQLAQRLEEHARSALKATTQKIQYAAALREVDDRERARIAIARPLKELEARCTTFQEEIEKLRTEKAQAEIQFQELYQIFLSEHENQVLAREQLQTKQKKMEAIVPPSELNRFNRLLQPRQGKAVVAVENGACTGCRVKLRGPLLTQLRGAENPIPCESCQRILYLP